MKPPVYLCACYARHAEIAQIAARLARLGYRILSTWHTAGDTDLDARVHAALQDETNFVPEDIAVSNLPALPAPTCILVFSEGAGSETRGGRHFETGFFYADGKRICVIGEREHLFHRLPDVEQYASLDAWLLAEETI